MPSQLFVVDAFAAAPFTGNPAAVVLPAGPAPADSPEAPAADARLAAIAAEMNLSETAFAAPRADGTWDLRWFTPTVEVDLCGHATLATAHVLWETGRAPAGTPIRFHTRSGPLAAVLRADGWIDLDLPIDPVRPIAPPDGLEAALGARPVFVGSGAANLLVELGSAAEVRALRPDQGWLATAIPDGLIATARADAPDPAAASGPAVAIVSRYFCPAAGIPEDPVTGSAHCALAPHWAPRIGPSFRALQASARGGLLDVTLRDDRVGVAGAAVTVVRGELVA
jgi:PhzF family phenazine biosynthesis protein